MKVTSQQLKRLIQEVIAEDITDDLYDAGKKHRLLVQNMMGLLEKWQPTTDEGRLYKQQLDDALTVTEGR